MSESWDAIYAAVRSKISGGNISEAVESVCREAFDVSHSKGLLAQAITNIEYDLHRASVLFRPKLMLEGNQWMALYGDDFRTGFAAFGDSPALAMEAFDKAWHEKLVGKTPEKNELSEAEIEAAMRGPETNEADCQHERLNADGQCIDCGEDKRGI
jgi:hypothetical protein